MYINLLFPAVLAMLGCGNDQLYNYSWKIHSKERPAPDVVTPGIVDSAPPSDAIVLFDGTDLNAWEKSNGQTPQWKIENGYCEVVRKTGSIQTKQKFGDCQLHIEWATPQVVKGDDQGRGNSGVFLMEKYEVQVLDSYNNSTYPDGQAGSIYGQRPPMVNVCKEAGQWQSYDIIFRKPVFKGEKLVHPATITILQNGVLVQDHWTITGPTAHKNREGYKPHPDKLSIMLQDHGNPMRFRNIWIRELE